MDSIKDLYCPICSNVVEDKYDGFKDEHTLTCTKCCFHVHGWNIKTLISKWETSMRAYELKEKR